MAALRGGFAYGEINVPKDEVMILEASGHSSVFVNGEPRAGDVYSFGTVKIPVFLKAGKNSFLFRGGRGGLKASLTRRTGPLQFNMADVTLPDITAEAGKEYWAAAIVMNATPEVQKDLVIEARLGDSEPVRSTIAFLAPLEFQQGPIPVQGFRPAQRAKGCLGSDGSREPGRFILAGQGLVFALDRQTRTTTSRNI